MSAYQKIDIVREVIRDTGAVVPSPYGETREMTGLCVNFDAGEARELAAAHVRPDHPELVPFAADADRVARILTADPTSRRAVSYVGRAGPNGEEEVCIPVAQYARRGGCVHGFFYARSVDMRRFPEDAIALAHCVAAVAARVGDAVGPLTVFLVSGHVYLAGGGKAT